jgi:hypothetical protein
MSQSDGKNPSTTEPDYDAILRANLENIFNERDASKRAKAVEDLFSDEPIMYEPAGIVTGRSEISDVAGALLKQFGPDFSFVPQGKTVGHHGLGYLRWHAGPKNGPVTVTGADAAEIREGKIVRLWVLLDDPKA